MLPGLPASEATLERGEMEAERLVRGYYGIYTQQCTHELKQHRWNEEARISKRNIDKVGRI